MADSMQELAQPSETSILSPSLKRSMRYFLQIYLMSGLFNIQVSASAPIQSRHYTIWQGSLEGLQCDLEPNANTVTSCGLASTLAQKSTYRLEQGTSRCFVCSADTVVNFDPTADDTFYTLKPTVWPVASDGAEIVGGVRVGQIFDIRGVYEPGDDNFAVFWRMGSVHKNSEDIAFKIQFAFEKQQDGTPQRVTLKSKINDVHTEYDTWFSDSLLAEGQTFRVLVLVALTEYRVYISDSYCCNFPHVVTDLSSIVYLFINTSPSLVSIAF